jgi:vancomycin resistance protein YoaR
VFFNYVDLRFANETDGTFQLRLWPTDIELRGQIRADRRCPHAYRVVERGHRFVREPDGTVTRENELWRLALDASGSTVEAEELIAHNRAGVRYPVDPERCEARSVSRGQDDGAVLATNTRPDGPEGSNPGS